MKAPFPQPKYKLIGHRGAAGLRPENTMNSFAYAVELGLNWIEFDVQLTHDDQWVVIHDDTLDRTTNGKGLVCAHTLAEIRNLEAGLWFKPPYQQLKVPTLIEVINFAHEQQIQVNIEIKGSEDSPAQHASHMANFLNTYADRFAFMPLLSSFDPKCLVFLRKLLPALSISLLVEEYAHDTIRIAQSHNFISINCDEKNITTENIERTLAHDIEVLLYTVNDPDIAKHWFDHGVSAVFTDRPDLFLNI